MKPRAHHQAQSRASRRETPRTQAQPLARLASAILLRVSPGLDHLIILPR